MSKKMEKYSPQIIERKWQEKWEERPGLFLAKDKSEKEKAYILDMFPYPSADGLHAGHVESYTATDIVSRCLRMKGKNVLHSQGWDAFGLPSENYAIKTKTHPSITTQKAIANFKRQMKMMGFSYDWSREIDSSNPEYYKWTQWFFLLLYKKGLAYKAKAKVNWCESCQTVLANEQAEGGVCERCNTQVIQKDLEQWFFKITDFIEDKDKTSGLISGLDKIDWPEHTKTAQRNWIGKSEGAQFRMAVIASDDASKAEERGNPAASGNFAVKYGQILLATNNLSKKARVEKLLKAIGAQTKILTPKDLGIEIIESKEEGNLFENAKEKAELYRGKTNLPVLGIDTGFFMQGEEIDPVKVKRNALDGKDEKELNQTEIGKLIHEYYKDIVRKRGGKVDAYWQDVAVLSLPDGTTQVADDKREVIITDKVKGEIDIYFPLRSLYVSKATGKYIADQTEADELLEQRPFIETLKKLLCLEKLSIEVFTTRLDTVFGMTFALIAPEHELVRKLKPQITNWDEVEEYISETKKKSELQRVAETKEKTGVELKGVRVINPFTKKEIPLFASDFVLAHYGTGAVMAVPGHDQRDYEFAKKFGLPIVEVIKSVDGKSSIQKEAFVEDGVLSNSREYDNATSEEARNKLTAWLEKNKIGSRKINYKMRDWLISRQRYWGAPIPIIYCEKCGIVPVPESDLPVLLPDDVDFMPAGESPLVRSKKFHNVKCSKCGAKARRESDTMDTFVCSSWYYFRYADPNNEKEFASKEKIRQWLPVDLYVGGAEHTVLHLLYSRFFTKVLHRLGYIDFDEPFLKLRHQGIILAQDGKKMSKSLGNVVNPDDVVEKYGADSLRMFEMFMGPLEDLKQWNTKGITGVYRFLERTWKIKSKIKNQKSKPQIKNEKLRKILHKTIKKVSEDIEKLRFNTAISSLMIFLNAADKDEVSREIFETFLILLSPFAPHIAEELWSSFAKATEDKSQNKYEESIFKQSWPQYDPSLVKEKTIELVIQVNGKVRHRIQVPSDISEAEAKKAALESEKIKKWLGGKEPKKVIFVKGKLVNIVL